MTVLTVNVFDNLCCVHSSETFFSGQFIAGNYFKILVKNWELIVNLFINIDAIYYGENTSELERIIEQFKRGPLSFLKI